MPDQLTLSTGDATYPTVSAWIAADGYEKGITHDDRPWRQIVYRIIDIDDAVAGRKSDLFIDALKGFSQTDILTNWNLSKYVTPHRYPLNTRLWCVDARAGHRGTAIPAENLHETNYVEIYARYEPIPYAVAGETAGTVSGNENTSTIGGVVYPWVTIRKSKSTKTYRIDRSSLKSADDDTSVLSTGFQKQIPIITYHFTYHRVPWNGDDFDDLLFGTVNDAPVFGKATGTLRYDGAEAEPTGIGRGETGYDVTIDLTWNPYGWNKDIPAGKVDGETVVFEEDELVMPYIPADFSILELTLPELP